MTEKKKTVKSKKIKATPSLKAEPKVVIKEDAFPVIEIARMLNVSSFDLFRLEQEEGIRKDSFMTVSEFTDKYNSIKGR